MDHITYQFEYDERIPVAFIGAGGHSYRNVYPSFQYAPIDLRAVCDLDADRAAKYARLFGAPRSYADHREMLERERPAAVFVVTSYTEDGRVQATDLAVDCLRAGAHVWMEKPTAASVAEIRQLQRESAAAGRFVMTGLKKIFTPAMERTKEIISAPEFGEVSSISLRYPQSLPAFEKRRDLVAMRGFLDHIYHPGAVMHHLMGEVRGFGYQWEPASGASTASLRFASGAIGTLHLAAGSAATSPLERVEVVGQDANVVVDNSVRLTRGSATAARPPTSSTRTTRRCTGSRSSPWDSSTTRTSSISVTCPRSCTSVTASCPELHPPRALSTTHSRSCGCSRPTAPCPPEPSSTFPTPRHCRTRTEQPDA